MEALVKRKRAPRTKAVPAIYPNLPTKKNEIDEAFILAYCAATHNNKWLKKTAQKEKVGADGKARRYSFFQIREEFVNQFYPALIEAKAVAKNSWFNQIMALEDN